MADSSNEENVFLGHCCGMCEVCCRYGYEYGYAYEEWGERMGRWVCGAKSDNKGTLFM